jgi:hypothetical protein
LTNVFTEAMRQGLRVYGKVFHDGKYHDVGTPEALLRTRFDLEYRHSMAAI